LTHYICLWFAFQRLEGVPLVARWGVFVISAVLLPVLLYHGLEAPMVRCSARLADRLSRPSAAVTI
jgi:peptidoglycan/LPS O-acetylase OafA/YrhL